MAQPASRLPKLAAVALLALAGLAPQPGLANNTSPAPGPAPAPLQVIACPDQCLECGNPGLLCCLPRHRCVVIWWPIWFAAEPGDAPLLPWEPAGATPAFAAPAFAAAAAP